MAGSGNGKKEKLRVNTNDCEALIGFSTFPACLDVFSSYRIYLGFGCGKQEAPVSGDLLALGETAWVEESRRRNAEATGKRWQGGSRKNEVLIQCFSLLAEERAFSTKSRTFSKPIHMVQGLGASALYELLRSDLKD